MENKVASRIQLGMGKFILLSAVLVIFTSFRFPSLSFRAEPWAETATNYFAAALVHPPHVSFHFTDALYLGWLPRVLTIIFVNFLGMKDQFFIAIQYAGIVFIAVYCSMFLLTPFRSLIKSDVMRALIGLMLGLHWGFGMYVFNNFSYYAAIPAFLFPFFLMIQYQQGHKKFSFLTLLVSIFLMLAITTKAYFIVFIPCYLAFVLFFIVKRYYFSILYFIAPLYGLFTQLSLIFEHRKSPPVGAVRVTDWAQQWPMALKNTFYFVAYGFENLFVGLNANSLSKHIGSALFIGTALLMLFIFLIYRTIKQKDLLGFSFAMMSLGLAVVSELITVAAFYGEPLPTHVRPSFLDETHHFFFMALVFLAFTVAIIRVFKESKWCYLILFVFLVRSETFGFVIPNRGKAIDHYSDHAKSPSQWKLYGLLINEPAYCIPINPVGWYFSKGCEPIRIVTSSEQRTEPIPVQFEESSANWKILAIHINNSDQFLQDKSEVELFLHDKDGKIIAQTKQMTDSNHAFVYFLFEGMISNVSFISLRDKNGMISISSEKVTLLGQKI